MFGYDLAIMAGANIYLREQFQLSNVGFGFTQVSAVLGCIAGPIAGGWLCDYAGRKKTLILSSVFLMVSAIFTAVAPDIMTLNIFRFIGGIGIGLCSVCSPMYIAETAPSRIRGAFGVMYQLAIVVGTVISAIVAYYLARLFSETTCWRWMFASEVVAIGVFVLFLFFLPESPRWLFSRGSRKDALAVLKMIDGEEYAVSELEQMEKSSFSGQNSLFVNILRPGIGKLFAIGFLLAFFNTWTGWTNMSGYIPYLFQKAGLSDKSQAILQLAFAYGFMLVVTTLACFLVDRIGRKPIWIFSSALMTVGMFLLGLAFYFNMTGIFILVIISLCAIPHSFALGPLPWLMMSEIFPTNIRAKAVSVTTTVLWIFIFLAGFVFPLIADYSEKKIGSVAGVFWLFSVISFFALIFGFTLLPETKGKTLEEISGSSTDPESLICSNDQQR